MIQEIKNLQELPLDKVNFQFFTYNLEDEEIQSEELCVDSNGEPETVSAANYCLLPHVAFDGIWENLIFDANIKKNVSNYTGIYNVITDFINVIIILH